MFKKLANKAVLAAAGLLGVVGSASAQVTFPEPLGAGVTLSDYITLAITSMGGIVITALGGYFAFVLVRKGLRWIRTAI